MADAPTRMPERRRRRLEPSSLEARPRAAQEPQASTAGPLPFSNAAVARISIAPGRGAPTAADGGRVSGPGNAATSRLARITPTSAATAPARDRGGIDARGGGPAAATRPTPPAAPATAGTAERPTAPAAAEKGRGAAPGGAARPAAGARGRREEGAATPADGTAAGAGTRPAQGGVGGEVQLLMPEPPESLSPAARHRLGQAHQAAGQAAEAQHVDLPPAEARVADARGAVEEPSEEANARAEAELVAALGEQPAPSPELEELCQRIYQIIASKRPPDEEKLVEAEPEVMARDAGQELDGAIRGDVERVGGTYQPLQGTPTGTPTPPIGAVPPPPGPAEVPPIAAGSAAPDAVPPENVSLDADVSANEARMRDAGMDSPAAALVQSGPIADARAAQGELGELAARAPAEVLAEQQTSLAQARADMAGLQRAALEALNTSRSATTADAREKQVGLVGSEEQMRTQAGGEARAVFLGAQTQVRELLRPLVPNATKEWTDGVAVLSSGFKAKLSEVEAWIRERHSGGLGSIVSVWDDVTGMPDWVTEAYDKAEKAFGDGVCNLVREISRKVNGIVATCEAIIAHADGQIATLFNNLPESLRSWAEGEQAGFRTQLDGLRNEAAETRDGFNRDLARRAGESVQEVREQIHGLRQQARGVIGRVVDAIARFLEDPLKAILEGLLGLLGIPPAAFWAVVDKIKQVIDGIVADPMGFANNLMDALAQGFSRFFDNIGTHLLQGLMDWLLSGLKDVGVELPKDLSLKSIATFFLQLMGLSWARIRKLLAKHVGEENVALIEKAWSFVSTLIERGVEGLYDLVKDYLNPQTIIDQVLQIAKDVIVEALIKQVTARIIALFNPVGAIVQAVEAIYRVLKWIFTNAAKLFRLVETVANGAYDVLNGNIGAMAAAVETALAGLISPVIDFLADYMSIGDLPDKISGTIANFQEWIAGILDRVIGWLVEKGKALLKAVGLGQEGEEGGGEYDGEIGKVVTFTAVSETHRLRIVVRGTDAVVMMKSEEKPVSEYLDEYESHATTMEVAEKRQILGLTGTARQILAELDGKADSAVAIAAKTVPKSDEIKASDDAVEGAEDRLGSIIDQILEIILQGEPYTEIEKEAAKTGAENVLDLIRPDGWYGKAAIVREVYPGRTNRTPSGPMGPHVLYEGRTRSGGARVLGLQQGRSRFSDYGILWRRQQSIPQKHHIASNKGEHGYNFSTHPAFLLPIGLSIEDPANWIYLHGHAGAHSSSYHEEVKQAIDRAVERAGGPNSPRLKNNVIAALNSLRARIIDGTLPLYDGKEVYE